LLKHELDYNEECEIMEKGRVLTDVEIAMLDNMAEMIFAEDIQGLEELFDGLYPKLSISIGSK